MSQVVKMTEPGSPRQMFFTRLAALANMVSGAYPNWSLSKDTVAMYDKLLRGYGYERLCHALDQVILARSSRDPFPSVKEIIAVIEPKTDPKMEAIEAANRIFEAVSKDGYTNYDRAKNRMGELAWAIVQSEGGWRKVCETTTDKNMTTLKAQWRQAAEAKLARAELGLHEEGPKLQIPSTRPKGNELTSFGDVLKMIESRKENSNESQKEDKKNDEKNES